jgi:photosystem II stability/assembly factor-like uncharacterized protein
MDEDPAPSDHRRRAVPLIAAAVAALIITGVLYLQPPSPAVRVTPPHADLLSGAYSASYDFFTPSLGWALVLDYGSLSTTQQSRFWIFKTSDGAAHWSLQFTGDAVGARTYVHMFNAQEGFAYAGRTYRTIDGGAHWLAIEVPGELSYVTFASPSLGWVMQFGVEDQHLLRTSDRGQTWTEVAELPFAVALEPIGSDLTSTIRPTGVGWLGASFLPAPSVYVTVDLGQTWRKVDLPAPTSAAPPLRYSTSVRLTPGDDAVVFVRDLTGHPLAVFLSSDLGLSWRTLQLPAAGVSEDELTFVDGHRWWVLRFGRAYRTDDAGVTWADLAVSGVPPAWRLEAGRAIDARHAWWALVSQENSTLSGLLMTSDGGSHWRMVNAPQPGG